MAVIADRCPNVARHRHRHQRRPHRRLEQRPAADLRARAGRGGAARPRQESVLLDRRRRRHPRRRHHLRVGQHADQDVRRGRRPRRRPAVLGEDGAADPRAAPTTARSSSRNRRCRCAPPRRWRGSSTRNAQRPALRGAVQSRVPRRGQRHQGSRGSRPRADRLARRPPRDSRRVRRSSTSTRSGCRASASSSRTSGAPSSRS